MAARDVTDGVSHRQHGQPEREGDTQKADPQVWKARSQDRGAAAAEYQPKGAKELCGNAPRHVDFHESPPSIANNTLSVKIEVLNNLSCGLRRSSRSGADNEHISVRHNGLNIADAVAPAGLEFGTRVATSSDASRRWTKPNAKIPAGLTGITSIQIAALREISSSRERSSLASPCRGNDFCRSGNRNICPRPFLALPAFR